MHSILLLPIVTRCLETIYVCIWHMFVFMSAVVKCWCGPPFYFSASIIQFI